MEIRARGYTGGYSILKAYLAPLKAKPADPVVRFETNPGVQMQVDFTTIKRGRQSLKAFVATLGYSRASYVRFTHNEQQADWIEGIQGALEYFGGVEILFDHAKCIVIQRDAYGEGQHQWNQILRDQANDYGYLPRACRPYRARTKGKVERFNAYLKRSFVTPLSATLTQAGLELTVDAANAHGRPLVGVCRPPAYSGYYQGQASGSIGSRTPGTVAATPSGRISHCATCTSLDATTHGKLAASSRCL